MPKGGKKPVREESEESGSSDCESGYVVSTCPSYNSRAPMRLTRCHQTGGSPDLRPANEGLNG